MKATEARQLTDDYLENKEEHTFEKWASSALDMLYSKIRVTASCGSSSYIFSVPVSKQAHIEFFGSAFSLIAANLRKNKYTVTKINMPRALAIEIKW